MKPDDAPRRIADLFAAIDAKDADRFLSHLADDASFVYANAPAAVGREAIRAAVTGFFASVRALSHTLRHVWTMPGHAVVEGSVHYVRHDSREVTLPFAVVLDGPPGPIRGYRIYVDGTPLYAA